MSDKKYSARSMPVITRESYNVENAPRHPNWMDEFASNLEKQSVQTKDKADRSIYDQITSIMGNKSKHPTVEAAVEDMKERSGLTKYLNKLKSVGQTEGSTKKKAASNCDCGNANDGDHNHDEEEVKLFEKVPQIKNTTDNYIEDTNGNLPLPAIVEKIKSIHRTDVTDDSDWDDESFLQYINDKGIEVNKKHPGEDPNFRNLGKTPSYSDEEIDPSNSDALHSLTPAVVSK